MLSICSEKEDPISVVSPFTLIELMKIKRFIPDFAANLPRLIVKSLLILRNSRIHFNNRQVYFTFRMKNVP